MFAREGLSILGGREELDRSPWFGSVARDGRDGVCLMYSRQIRLSGSNGGESSDVVFCANLNSWDHDLGIVLGAGSA